MSQPGTDEITPVQRKHLGLILEAPKGCTADNTVIIFLKLCPQVRGGLFLVAADAVVAKQCLPIHTYLLTAFPPESCPL